MYVTRLRPTIMLFCTACDFPLLFPHKKLSLIVWRFGASPTRRGSQDTSLEAELFATR